MPLTECGRIEIFEELYFYPVSPIRQGYVHIPLSISSHYFVLTVFIACVIIAQYKNITVTRGLVIAIRIPIDGGILLAHKAIKISIVYERSC